MNNSQLTQNTRPLIQSRRDRRRDRHRGIPLPRSSDNILIFPCVENPSRFYRKNYNPNLTEGKLKMAELNTFFDSLDVIVQKNLGSMRTMKYLFYAVLIAGLIAMVLYGVYVGTHFSAYMLALAIYLAFLLTASMVMLRFTKKKLLNTRSEAKAIISKTNESLSFVGLKWMMPANFPKWIELWNEYKMQPNENHQQNPVNGSNQGYVQGYAISMPPQGPSEVIYSDHPDSDYHADRDQGDYHEKSPSKDYYSNYQKNTEYHPSEEKLKLI